MKRGWWVGVLGVASWVAVEGAWGDGAESNVSFTETATIERAAFAYYADYNRFPPSAFGRVPRGLGSYLPAGFQMRAGGATWGWVGLRSAPEVAGVVFRHPDPAVVARVAAAHRGRVIGLPRAGLIVLLLQ